MSHSEYNTDKGAFIISRSIFESDIWFKPPEYLKIWIYLIGKANHKDRKYNGYLCKRGQYFCPLKELKAQIQYFIGYRTKKVNVSTVKNIMKYLRSNQMIITTKKPRGVLIEVVKYDLYQDLTNYEKTREPNNEKSRKTPGLNQDTPPINKNDKELNNLKKNEHDNDTLKNPGNEDCQSKNFNRKLSEKEESLIDDFLSWAYEPENKFNIEKPTEKTREQIENTVRKYGYDAIERIFCECSEERIPWDYHDESNISAYAEFWESVKYLKFANEKIKEKDIIKKVSDIVDLVNGVTEKNFSKDNCRNLKELILNNISNNDISIFIMWFVKDIGFKENPSVLDNVTLDDIFSKENWSKFLSKSKRKGVN